MMCLSKLKTELQVLQTMIVNLPKKILTRLLFTAQHQLSLRVTAKNFTRPIELALLYIHIVTVNLY